MKVSMFHLMPYRDVPDDFEKKHRSAWFTVKWSDFADPQKVVQYYNWTLDELAYAAKMGFDGVCVNEHHQNCYGFMVNPNMMGAALAKMTEGRFRHMPVVEDGQMVGLITLGDVVKARLSELAMEKDALQGMIMGH